MQLVTHITVTELDALIKQVFPSIDGIFFWLRDIDGFDTLTMVEVTQDNFYKFYEYGEWDAAIRDGHPNMVMQALLWQLREDGLLGYRTNHVLIEYEDGDY